MKNINTIIRLLVLSAVLFSWNTVVGQDEEEDSKPQPARKSFESAWLIDDQTDVVNTEGTLEMMIQHRFGQVANGASDLWGIYAPGNIRIGFTYSILDRLSLGLGASKVNVGNPYVDGNVKFKILQQTRENEIPVNLTYYGNVVLDTRDTTNFNQFTDRFSYFHQLILSRRISYKFSVQLTGSFSHFNAVDSLYSNDVIAVGLGARYKISPQTSIMLTWNEPFTEHEINSVADESLRRNAGPYRNIGIGAEIATSSHAFQVFFSTYRDNLPQFNQHFNTNEWAFKTTENGEEKTKLGFLIGFNITRLWNY